MILLFSLVHKPVNLSWEEAAGSLISGMRSQLALHMANSKCGDSILILDGNVIEQQICIQLALFRGLTVFTTICNSDSTIPFDNVIIINTSTENLFEVINEHTSGLGVDIIVEPPNMKGTIYSISELIGCIGTFGKWITSRNLQLDPPATQILLFKSSSLIFLFEQSWMLSTIQQGRYLRKF